MSSDDDQQSGRPDEATGTDTADDVAAGDGRAEMAWRGPVGDKQLWTSLIGDAGKSAGRAPQADAAPPAALPDLELSHLPGSDSLAENPLENPLETADEPPFHAMVPVSARRDHPREDLRLRRAPGDADTGPDTGPDAGSDSEPHAGPRAGDESADEAQVVDRARADGAPPHPPTPRVADADEVPDADAVVEQWRASIEQRKSVEASRDPFGQLPAQTEQREPRGRNRVTQLVDYTIYASVFVAAIVVFLLSADREIAERPNGSETGGAAPVGSSTAAAAPVDLATIGPRVTAIPPGAEPTASAGGPGAPGAPGAPEAAGEVADGGAQELTFIADIGAEEVEEADIGATLSASTVASLAAAETARADNAAQRADEGSTSETPSSELLSAEPTSPDPARVSVGVAVVTGQAAPQQTPSLAGQPLGETLSEGPRSTTTASSEMSALAYASPGVSSSATPGASQLEVGSSGTSAGTIAFALPSRSALDAPDPAGSGAASGEVSGSAGDTPNGAPNTAATGAQSPVAGFATPQALISEANWGRIRPGLFVPHVHAGEAFLATRGAGMGDVALVSAVRLSAKGLGRMELPDPRALARDEALLALDDKSIGSIKRLLASAGFPAESEEGTLDGSTRSALARWQASVGLPVTGYFDGRTVDALAALPEPKAEPVAAKPKVRRRAARAAPAESPIPPRSAPEPAPVQASGGCKRTASGALVPGQSLGCDVQGLFSGFSDETLTPDRKAKIEEIEQGAGADR